MHHPDGVVYVAVWAAILVPIAYAVGWVLAWPWRRKRINTPWGYMTKEEIEKVKTLING